MNKIRVCAFLALVVFIGSVVTDMFSGFMDGWNEAGDQKDFHALPSVSLLVRADDTLPADTLISAAQDTPMYCNTSEVSVQGFRSTKWRWVSFLLFPAGLFALYGFYSVARLVLTATKGEVFVHKNVRRMRIFVYALISVSLLFELQQWGIYHDLASQVRLEGYEVLPYSFKYAWFNYIRHRREDKGRAGFNGLMWGEDYEKDKYIGYPGYIGHCCRVYLCDDSGLGGYEE